VAHNKSYHIKSINQMSWQDVGGASCR